MSRRLVLVLYAAAVLAPVARASFDLSLIPQVVTGRIQRHDPVTNVALGSFGAPNANNVTLDQANNRVFVSDPSSGFIRSYNYNTGDSMGVTFIGVNVAQFAYNASVNSLFYVTTSGTIGRYNFTTGANNTIAGVAGVSYRTLDTRDGIVSLAGVTSGNALHYTAINASTFAIQDQVGIGFLVSGTRLGKACLSTNGSGYQFGYTGVSSTGTLSVYFGGVTTSGFLTFATSTTLPNFNSTVVLPSIANAHDGYFAIGQDIASTTSLRVEGYTNNGVLLHQNVSAGYSFGAGNFGAANVVAPEPASMLALAGAVGLVLRRRRNSTR